MRKVDLGAYKVRLQATARESGAWIKALPVTSLRPFDSETFRIAIGLRVGTDRCIPHSCRCDEWMDRRRLHACPLNTVLAAWKGTRQ